MSTSSLANWEQRQTKFSMVLLKDLIETQKDTIWLSAAHKSAYHKSENGMIQYNHKSDRIMNIIQYPDNIKPVRQYCVEYNKKIYIIDGENKHIIEFDPESKSFTIKTKIPELGGYATCIKVFNRIHIFHGRKNTSHYLIYDPETNKVIDHKIDTNRFNGSAVLLYQNRIIKIGGNNKTTYQISNTFSISW